MMAVLLFLFISNKDWGKTKVPLWITHLFTSLLFVIIMHNILLALKIDIFAGIDAKKLMATLLLEE
jgi:hypothetical protein